MTPSHAWTLSGPAGDRNALSWPAEDPRLVVLLSHGYGEHIGRYHHVADALVAAGAVVHGIDHVGHGRSAGEPAVVEDYDVPVADLHRLAQHARAENPGLPVALVGHSMGGLIALRYAQQHGEELAALVLSGPQVAGKEMLQQLLAMPEIPSFGIDASVLSRDATVGEAYLADPLVWHGDLQRPTMEAMVRAMTQLEEAAPLSGLPVLWLHGTEDQLSPLEGARPVIEATVPSDRLEHHAYAGAQHEIFNETNRDEVLGDLTGFLTRSAGRTAG